jgi:filamentous hemagglutinin family protein
LSCFDLKNMMLQMSRFVLLLPSLVLLGLLRSETVQAQVSADGTLSTTVTSADPRNFVIEQGDRAGGNLFHSFRQFSVPTGGSAHFNNAADVQNIFARVTGGNSSNIDGLIRANGAANLFLLNPSGILFGPNARLDIGGSFIGTTASVIKFSDGTEFSATNSASPPLLTMSVPIGLQMGNNPGTITVQGGGHQLTQPSFFAPILQLSPATGLGVAPGNTLALIGGAIALNGGVLTAPSGHIELGSVSSGTVSLNPTAPQWQFGYGNIPQFADLRLSQQSLVDASGTPAGSLQLQGRNISFLEGSVARLQNLGGTALGDLVIHASGLLEMRQVGTSGFQNNLLSSENLGTGAGSDLRVSAQRLNVQDGGVITSKAFSAGAGGDMILHVADTLFLDGWSALDPTVVTAIGAATLAAGNGGEVTLSARQLRLSNGANILNLTAGTGLSGNIAVTAADRVEVVGGTPLIRRSSSLANTTINRGNGGSLNLTAPTVIVQAGASIGTSTLAPGNGGNLTINASDRIEVSGMGEASGQQSRIVARAEVLPEVLRQAYGLPAFPEGNAGSLIMNTPSLQVSDRALVGVDHQGIGNAGNFRLNADITTLDRGGSITASTRSGGGGNLNLQTHTLTLHRGSNVVATAGSVGNGGQITIAADRLDLLGNSRISTQAQGSGNAGTLNLQVDRLTLNRGQIGVESGALSD